MKKFSFEGIGETVATFACEADVLDGQVVKLTENATVGPCSSGDRFCGVALCVKDGCASVQVEGLAVVPVAKDLSVGWVKLSADGNGGVQVDETTGTEFLVVCTNPGTATIRL